MKLIRTIVFTVSLVLLGAGYTASQIAYHGGSFQDYAARVDCTPVRVLAMLLLVCCVVFPLVGKPSEAAEK